MSRVSLLNPPDTTSEPPRQYSHWADVPTSILKADRPSPLPELFERLAGTDAYAIAVDESILKDDVLPTEQGRMEMLARGFTV